MAKNAERTSKIPAATEIRRKAAYHHGDLRAQLVAATRRLVEEKGPEHFSVSEACRAAGVSTAAPYRHFHDKQDMLIEVAKDGMRRMREDMRAAIDSKGLDPLEALPAIGLVYVRFAEREPNLFRLMFGLTKHHRDRPDLIEAGLANFAIVREQVARHLGKNDIDDEEVRRLAFSLWTFVHGLSFLLIDEKVDLLQFPVDIEGFIQDIAVRHLTGAVPGKPG